MEADEEAVEQLKGLLTGLAIGIRDGVTEKYYRGELRKAKDEKAKLQEEIGIVVNNYLGLKKPADFLSPKLFRTVIKTALIYDSITHLNRFSKVLLDTYDELEEKYSGVNAKIQNLPNVPTNEGELEGLVDGAQINELHIKLKPTLDELTTVHRQTLQSIDNYRRLLVEKWQFLYPKKEFPRDISGLYNGATVNFNAQGVGLTAI